MNFDEIKKDLLDFEVYKKKLLLIDESEKYNLFYLIIFNGKVHVFNNTRIETKKIKDEFVDSKKYVDLSDYVKKELKGKYIEKNLYKKDFQIITYIIPEDDKTKNDFNKMNEFVFKFDNSHDKIFTYFYAKLFNHINKYHMAYIGIYTLYLLVYTAYLYLGLNSVGIPFDLIISIESFIAMIFILISGIILTLTLIIPIIVGIIYLDNDTISIIMLIFLIAYIVNSSLLIKNYKFVFFYFFIKFLVSFLCNIFCRIIPVLALLILLSLPFVYILELSFLRIEHIQVNLHY